MHGHPTRRSAVQVAGAAADDPPAPHRHTARVRRRCAGVAVTVTATCGGLARRGSGREQHHCATGHVHPRAATATTTATVTATCVGCACARDCCVRACVASSDSDVASHAAPTSRPRAKPQLARAVC